MYLYPYKIFCLSKNKRILNTEGNPSGIYDAVLMNYKTAVNESIKRGTSVSVLLGTIASDINLICLDLDDCFDSDGNMEAQTEQFLQEFDNSEYEVSSSGTGIHVYILTKKKFDTFIVKELEGCKSFECYTNKRHIVTVSFDFENTNLTVGKHDDFLQSLYDRVNEQKKTSVSDTVKQVFQGEEVKNDNEVWGRKFTDRKPVTDMYTLRGCGYKDPVLIECIDMNPDSVDQSAHDAKLIRKLMYYTFDFDSAWEMAKKTNYYKAKDNRHKIKFDNPTYKERTRQFIARGGGC